MNEGVKKYLEMQKRVYKDYPKNCNMAKDLVGNKSTFSTVALDLLCAQLLCGRQYTSVLDFGCGVGRLIDAFHTHCGHIDGVDLSPKMIKFAYHYLNNHNIPSDKYDLYVCNGYNLNILTNDNKYDLIYSYVVMQHICVWQIRNSYFKDFYRLLKPGGQIAIQLIGGNVCDKTNTSGWYDNTYDAQGTNAQHDVKLENVYFAARDLFAIGFSHCSFNIIPFATDIPAQPEFNIILRATK